MGSRKDASPVLGVPVAMVGQPDGGVTFPEGLVASLASPAVGSSDLLADPAAGAFLEGVPETPPLLTGGVSNHLGEEKKEEKKESGEVNAPIQDKAGIEFKEISFHVDYLKMSVWMAFSDLILTISSFCEESLGFVPAFVESKKGGLSVCQDDQSGLTLLYHESRQSRGKDGLVVPGTEWCQIQLRGEGCQRWGDTRLRELLLWFHNEQRRWRLSRVDGAWDYGRVGPRWFRDQIRAGNFVSRCLDRADVEWYENHKGETCYLGLRKDHKERLLRVYNAHGFNRVELEMSGCWAEKAGEFMADLVPSAWPARFLEILTGAVDLVDPSSASRLSRCSRLSKWSDFVGDCARVNTVSVGSEFVPSRLEVGKFEGLLQRNWRALAVAFLAFSGKADRQFLSDRVCERLIAASAEEQESLTRRAAELRRQVDGGYGRPKTWPTVEAEDVPF